MLERAATTRIAAASGAGQAARVTGRRGTGTSLRLVLETMRPRQWPKNAVVLVPLVFARVAEPGLVLRGVLATLLFCLLSGAVYLANDLLDVEKDRLHPRKRFRPLPAGRLSPAAAWAAAGTALTFGLVASAALAPGFGLVAASYVGLQIAYVFWLKHAVILDVLALASGFVLRAVAGAVVVGVPISPWLYVCALLLALFLALGKRRQELLLLTQESLASQDGPGDTAGRSEPLGAVHGQVPASSAAGNGGLAVDAGDGGAAGPAPTTLAAQHRPALEHYTVPLLDQLIQVVTTSLVVAYMLYTFSAEALPGNHAMMLTIPFVLYGLFRYLYLVQVRGEGGAPEDVLLRDPGVGLCVALWALACVVILYVMPRW
jgi:4-hydroxybenzoate polyprenyltransferase